jgi:hypothetical protein
LLEVAEAMSHRLKAALAGLAAAVASLFLTLPATAIITSRLPAVQMDNLQTDGGGLEFQAAYIDVSLLPALVFAVLTFVMAFMWMLRTRATKQ